MAGADGPRWAEADSARITAVKRGLNNIAEANETGGKAERLIVMLMLLKGLNECHWRYGTFVVRESLTSVLTFIG